MLVRQDSDSNHLKMFLTVSRELDVCWRAECICLVFSFCIFKLISSFQGGNLILFDCFVIMELLKRMFLRVFTQVLMQLIQVLFFPLLLLTALEAADCIWHLCIMQVHSISEVESDVLRQDFFFFFRDAESFIQRNLGVPLTEHTSVVCYYVTRMVRIHISTREQRTKGDWRTSRTKLSSASSLIWDAGARLWCLSVGRRDGVVPRTVLWCQSLIRKMKFWNFP